MNVTKVTKDIKILNSFECDVCKKIFKYKSQLGIHKGTHSGEKSYKFCVCDKGFSIKLYGCSQKDSYGRKTI